MESGTYYRGPLNIRRRFQFSSALKRMSTVSYLPGNKTVAAVKGAPETIKTMLAHVPEFYDETYKWYTRRGSRVLALGYKEMDSMSQDKVRYLYLQPKFTRLTLRSWEQINKLARDQVESSLVFVGFLVFHCPLKPDAVDALKMLADSSHRVRFPKSLLVSCLLIHSISSAS